MHRRILIWVGTSQDAALASQVLQAGNIESLVCTGTQSLQERLEDGCGALLIAEEVLTGTGTGVRPIRAFVNAQPPWSDLPVLLLTMKGSPSVEVQRAVETLGNVTLIERPVRTIGLISAARSALRARDRQYQVQLADRRKDEFLATLAHELRNPLAPIRTSMSVLRRLEPAENAVELISIVERQVGHLTRLVDDLLDVARISQGKVALQARRTTVRSVVTHALEISSSAIQERGHQLEVVLPDQEYALNADHARVVQSVANLLVNAAKFTPPGGRIRVISAVQEETVHFRVQDNGRGLEEQSKAAIFGLFTQAAVPGEQTSGLGIGLNLAKRFAEMHGGSIAVESSGLGCGSEFILSLPVVVKAEESSALPSPAIAHAAQGRKVLVVDDNADAANTLEALLSMEGFSVKVAYDGRAAVDAVRQEAPDIVLMDIGMPRMNGYEAAKEIRQASTDVTLIALTGWGQALDKRKSEEAGFNLHLVKPVDVGQLLETLRA